ncbi:alcohol dehydrogenase catalytic domain-containing protein [Ferrovibrio sp.]|uniref:zinc-dependent alcohol dehydrogenase n=1 Tax=Ferrovibrio sp. TaxID=1917215 RepID=UPI00260F8B44|nr:alcohol dehydrogenase catalytic domain-containing protein [Ferrovibrio sp.]
MQQLTLTGVRTLEWLEVPEPRLPSPLSAIVRPVAVGVCDFDRAVVTGRYRALRHPIAVGHEIVADIVEVGTAVRNVTVGMRVVLPLHISCGTCPSCGAGRTNSCSSRPALTNFGLGPAGGDQGGGMSDLLAVPYADAMCVPLPPGVSAADYAAVGCNLVDLYRAIVPHLDAYAEPSVLLVGGALHNMALYGIALARALGVSRIDYLDDDPERLEAAESMGAHPVTSAAKPTERHPIMVDCSGDPERLSLALTRVDRGGVCTLVYPYAETFPLPVGAMFARNVTTIAGQPHAQALIAPVLDLIRQGRWSSTSIPVEILSWDKAPGAFGYGTTKRIFVRE